MNDEIFEKWSVSLSELRSKREDFLNRSLRQKGAAFEPREYFDVAMTTIEQAIMSWWTFEQRFKDTEPKPYAPEDIKALRGEIESTLDLEIDAIQREIQSNRAHLAWKDIDVDDGISKLTRFAGELRGSYESKLIGLLPSDFVEPPPPEKPKLPEKKSKIIDPQPGVKAMSFFNDQSSNWSWTGLVVGCILGLIVGGGVTYYFRDISKKTQADLQKKVTRLEEEKQQLEDSITMIQQTFSNLAKGKTDNLKQLEEKIEPIRQEYAARRKRATEELEEKKKLLLRRNLEPEQHNKVLHRLNNIYEEQTKTIDAAEKSELEPLLKQYQFLRSMLK